MREVWVADREENLKSLSLFQDCKAICRTCWIWGTYLSDKRKTIMLSSRPDSFPYLLPEVQADYKCKTRRNGRVLEGNVWVGYLLLPSALLVAVRLEALPAFVFRHLQTSFLFQIAHRYKVEV
jgi:hypothetical protein